MSSLCYRQSRRDRAQRRNKEHIAISAGEDRGPRPRVIRRARLRQARWATAAYFLALGVAFGSWVARIPAVQNRLGLDDGQLGLSLLSLSFGAILAMPTTGWLVQKWGNPLVMRAAATGLCLAMPLLPLAPTMPLLMLALFVFGIFFGVFDVAMNVQAVAVEQRHGLPIMSSFHGVFSVGGLIGAASAGIVAGLAVAPFPHLLVVALLLFVVITAASRFLLDTDARRGETSAFALPGRALLGLGVLSFCALLSEGAVADWSAVYLENVLGSTAAAAASGYAAFSLAMAGMRFVGDALTVRIGPVWMVGGGGLLAGIGLTAALLIGTVPAMIMGFACMGIGLAAAFPIALGAAGRTEGMAPGSAIGAVSTAGYTGLLSGPVLIGFIADAASLRTALLVVAVLTLLSAALAGTVRRS
jgi:MFS family permease